MKTIRVLLWIITLLIVLAVGLVVVATKIIDPNDYKPQIISLVKEKTGRDLKMEGDLSLTFFPWVGVETGKLSLSNAEGFGDEPMLAVDTAQLKVQLLPLLKKRYEVDTVVLNGPRIQLLTRADGVTNWDDLIKKSGAEVGTSSRETQGAGAIAGLAVKGVSISDGFVRWDNRVADQELSLSAMNLDTGNLVPGEPLDISLSVDADGNMLPEAAAIKLDTTLTLSKNMASVGLADTGLSVAMQSIAAELKVDKISYALEAGLAAVNGLVAEVERSGVSSSLDVPSFNLNLSDQTLELPSFNLKQDDAEVALAVKVRGFKTSPAANGSFTISAGSVTELLKRNGLESLLADMQLDLDLDKLNTTGSFQYAGSSLALQQFSMAAELNQLPTRIELPSLNIDLAAETLDAPDILLEQTDFRFKGSLKGSGLLSAEGKRQLNGQIDTSIADIQSLVDRNGLKLDLSTLPLSNIKLKTGFSIDDTLVVAESLAAEMAYHGNPTQLAAPNLVLDLASGAIDLASVTLQQGDFSLSGSARGNGVTGALDKMAVSGKLQLQIADIAALLERNQIAVELPEGLVTQVATKVNYQLENNSLSLADLDTQIDQMSINGSVGLVNLAKPAYRFDLNIDTLDVDALTGASGGSDPAAASTDAPSTAEQLLLPVAPLRGLNVDGKARIGKLITTGLTLNDVSVVVKSDQDVLRVVPFKASLFGGQIETQLSYDVSQEVPSMKMLSKVSEVDIGALLEALEISKKISGTGNIDTNLTGSGANPDELIASLGGTIGFNLRDGALKGFDLQATLVKLENDVARYKGKQPELSAEPEAETKFAELSGTLNVENGVFRNDDFDMKAPLFRVAGRGAMDLPRSRIDYKVDVNVVKSIEGQGGASLGDLEGAKIPLKVYGSLNDPTFTLDLAQILKDEAKKEIKKELLKQLAPDLQVDPDASTEGQEQVPTDPKDALEKQLKDTLTKGLLKGLGFD